MIEYISIPEEKMKLLKTDKRWEQQLKKFLNIKISLNEDVEIESKNPLEVMRVKLVFQAFGRGFDFDDALNLLDEDFTLEIIEIGAYTKSRDRMVALKGRVIGTEGKSKNIIEKKTATKISVYGKTIAIIGRFENVPRAREAIEMILSGRKHGTVFRFLG